MLDICQINHEIYVENTTSFFICQFGEKDDILSREHPFYEWMDEWMNDIIRLIPACVTLQMGKPAGTSNVIYHSYSALPSDTVECRLT